MSASKRIVVFALGGTISMGVDAQTGAAVPQLLGAEILRQLGAQGAGIAQVEARDLATVGGSQVTPEMALSLAQTVQRALTDEGYDGAVVTQGTDGVEETSFLLDLVLDTNRPVVHAAAMRNNSELGADGPRNLRSAIIVAASDAARGHGVLVVLNDQILAASEVMKADTVNPASFIAPGRGPLGVVMRQGPVFFHRTMTRQHLPAHHLEPRVVVVRLCLGSDGEMIRAAILAGAKGIVLEGAGAGNVSERAVPAIREALDAGVPVVLTSSAVQGLVDDVYGYPGGGYHLRRYGVVLGQGLTAPKARIKLMLALGEGLGGDDIRALFEHLY